MGCLVPLLALVSPRLALFFVLIFSSWVGDAFEGSWWVPILGFFFLPWTTLAYILMFRLEPSGVSEFEWFIVAFAFVVDIVSYVRSRDLRPGR